MEGTVGSFFFFVPFISRRMSPAYISGHGMESGKGREKDDDFERDRGT